MLEYIFVFVGVVNIGLWLFLIREAWVFQKVSELAKATPSRKNIEHSAKVSVVFAARDEEMYNGEGLKSLLAQDYPDFEVIVVNDRSRDRTPEIIDSMASQDPRLKPLHIETLPQGWLGKNHALWQGAKIATGSYLLFTDGDVIFAPNTLSQSMEWLQNNDLDHIVLSPKFNSKTPFLAVLQAYFAMMFLLFTRPSLLGRSKHHYIGVGAFNLVKRSSYDFFGGHEALRLEVIDDVMLGRLMVQNGFRQMVFSGYDLLSLHWYENALGLHRGLRKNAFPAMGYSLGTLFGFVLVTFFLHVLPYVGLFFLKGWGLVAIGLSLILSHGFFMLALRSLNHSVFLAVLLSPAAIFLCTAHIRSTWACLWSGKVTWRETSYPIQELKKFRSESMSSVVAPNSDS